MSNTQFRRVLLVGALFVVTLFVLLASGEERFFRPALSVLELHPPTETSGRIHAALGLLLVAFFPGFLFVLLLPSRTARSWAEVLIETFGLSTVAHILNVTCLKLLGLPISPALLVGCGLLEAALVGLAGRRHSGTASVRLPDRGEALGALLSVLLTLYLVWNHRPFLARSLGDYFYADDFAGDMEAVNLEARGVHVGRSARWATVDASEYRLYRLSDAAGPETLEFRSTTPQRVTLRFLWQGPVGSGLAIDCEDVQTSRRVERAPVELPSEGPTLRYLDEGIVQVSATVPVRASRRCVLQPLVEPGAHGTIVDLTGLPAEVLWDAEALGGWVPIHYYQILNIAENVAWSREVLENRWVTRNQPPLWSYVYSSVNVYVGEGLWAVSLFFLVIVGCSVFLAWEVVRAERTDAPVWLMLPLLFIGLSHARIMVEPGSTNFPDNLYALAMLASFLALVRGRCGLFGMAGAATTLLRYSGSGLIVLMALVAAWQWPTRRRHMFRCLGWWAAVMGGIVSAFLLTSLVEGTLDTWLEVLYFETFPEHFHGNYDLNALMGRPPEFYWTLLKVTGFMPALWLFLRGRIPRSAALLTAGYTALLCFIDHFPSHYFVPPMYLVGIATAGLLARFKGWPQWGLSALCLVGMVWGYQLPM